MLGNDPEGSPFHRTWFLVDMGRLDEAEEALPTDHPDRISFLVTWAWIAALAGRPDAAFRHLDLLAAERHEPSLAPGRFRDFPDLPRALALLEAGRLLEALAVAEAGHEAAVERHPPFIRSWWLLLFSHIHTDLGRMRTAAVAFRRGEAILMEMEQAGLACWYLGGGAYAPAQTTDSAPVDDILARMGDDGNRDERLFVFPADAAGLWRAVQRSGRDAAAAELVAARD